MRTQPFLAFLTTVHADHYFSRSSHAILNYFKPQNRGINSLQILIISIKIYSHLIIKIMVETEKCRKLQVNILEKIMFLKIVVTEDFYFLYTISP